MCLYSKIRHNNRINYFYNSSGEKMLQAVSENGSLTEMAYYFSSFVHEGLLGGKSSLKYILTPEGRILNTGNDSIAVWNWEYYLKDHLGNVRVVIEPTTTPGYSNVLQENHYYPFGMRMSQLSSSANSTNDYLFSGKKLETDFGLNWYDFGGRGNYNAPLCVWHSIDRFAEKYYNLTTYQYAANNPMRYIDINGDSIWVNGYYYGYNKQYGYGFYDKSGALYTGNDVFMNSVNSALAELSLGTEGAALVNDLAGITNPLSRNFTIQNSSDNNFSPSDISSAYSFQIESNPSIPHGDISMFGSGGTINWNPMGANSGGVWVLGGGKDNNPIINLAHEMYHGRDAQRGLLWDKDKPQGRFDGLYRSEWQATYYENLTRRELKSPLREYYFSGKDPNNNYFPYPPRLLDANNNPIKQFWMP
jgi:RHS repeat-associated protein